VTGYSLRVTLDWWQYSGVGGLGALVLEAAQIALYVQRTGHTPWVSRDRRRRTDRYGQALPRFSIFCLALCCKTLTGLVLVGVLAAGHQVATPLTALLLGAAATNLLHRAAKQVPLPYGDHSATTKDAQTSITIPDEDRVTQVRRP